MTDPERLTPERLAAIDEFVGGSMMPPLYANELIDEIRAAWRERDLAIAHDRQPYPTAEAYELVCKARNQCRDECDRLREQVDAIRKLTGIKHPASVVEQVEIIVGANEEFAETTGEMSARIDALHARVGRAKHHFEKIGSQAKACIVSTEEECDMSANWVSRRCSEALAELTADAGEGA